MTGCWTVPDWAATGLGFLAGLSEGRGPGLLLLVGTGAVVLLVLGAGGRKRRSGGARWASWRDIVRCGGFGGQGVVLGRWGWRGRLLRAGGEGHTLLAAPTRSGKGVGFVIPNLLDWPGSVVVLDIKGENYAHTAGWRAAHGHEIHRFDPASRDTHCWNPFTYVDADPACRVRDLQQLATLLMPSAAGDKFWTHQARDLFVGAALLNLETKQQEVTLGDVHRLLALPSLREFVTGELTPREGAVSAGCLRRLLAWAGIEAAATRAGILASARESLLPWSDPILDAATSANDFDLAALRRRPMAVYVTVAPASLVRFETVLRVFFDQLIQVNATGEFDPRGRFRVPVLLMLDEFPAFGRMATIEKGIAYMASYGMRFCIIAQSEAQLRGIYGREGAQVLVDNCASRIYFAPNAMEEAVAISNALGIRRVEQRTRSRAQGLLGGRSVSMAEGERPLMRPQEVREIGADRAIVLTAGCRPILVQKIRWYRDRDYRSRRRPSPDGLPRAHN